MRTRLRWGMCVLCRSGAPRAGYGDDSALLSCRPRAYCLADSEEESSSAGSSEEDDAPEPSAGDKPLLPGAEG